MCASHLLNHWLHGASNTGEQEMVQVCLEQIQPFSLNPRVTRNPGYDVLKASILARGLDNPPVLTRRPGDEKYMLASGGNTRLAILNELWQETQDERYHRVCWPFRPWPETLSPQQGEVQCLIGHLAESDLHNGLMFIERAEGILHLRDLYLEAGIECPTQLALAEQLTRDGYPVSQSQISRMLQTVDWLLPCIPNALYGGRTRKVIDRLLALRSAAEQVWAKLIPLERQSEFADLFSTAVAVLPCKPDLRQLRFEVQHTRLADPAMAQELQDFVNDCYGPSRARLKRLGSDISEEQSQEVDWVGSAFYLATPGYYDHDHTRSPRAAWPYDASRDDGLNDTGGGGYPACQDWWSDSDAGLKNRLLKQVDTTLWQQLQKLGQSKEEYEEAVLRSLVSPRNMQVSQGGLVYNGFGGSAGDNFSQTQLLSRVGGIIGAGLSSYALFPAFDNVRQALPMVQAFLEMALVICIPVILLFSAWDLKTVITLSFVQFALFFLTFWWELARWLDNWLMQMMYDSDTHSYFNLWGLQNTSDDLIVNIIMGVMFLVLPAFWLGALTWAGVRIGAAIAGVMGSAVGDIRSAGEQVGKMIVSKTRIP